MTEISGIKKRGLLILLACCWLSTFAQSDNLQIEGDLVFKNDDVVIHQIDNHTWVGTGHLMFNESIYLVEGSESALLIDVGTKIKDLDKILATITEKPILLTATHVHPDHTGSAIKYFSEIFINPGDTALIPIFLPEYKGVRINYSKKALK